MSARDYRNKLFDAVTPNALKPLLHEHGREVANAISLSRVAAAPYLFYTAARGKKGVFSGTARLITLIGDGYDGYVAEQDKDFKVATPNVRTLHTFFGTAKNITNSDLSLPNKLTAVWHLLGDTDGSTFDQLTDKTAQEADQTGASYNNDLSIFVSVGTIVRNRFLDHGRNMYHKHGIKGAGKADATGQAKTIAFGILSTAEAFGLLDRAPRARKILAGTGAILNAYSGAVTIIKLEEQHLTNQGYATENIPKREIFTIGVARIITSGMPNIEITPAYHTPINQ